MMGFYIDSSGRYYEGDQQGSDKAVPQRPSPNHTFDGENWGLDIVRIRGLQLQAINTAATSELAALSAAYPDGEVQSWAQQTREAEALAGDPNAATPLLAAIATARGVPLATLAERVRAKVQAYAVASGRIIGQRQALEDAINAVDLGAPDAATQLVAIKWPVV